jgi:hypothetical protein
MTMRCIVPVLSLACAALAQTPMDKEPVKQPVRGLGLGTCAYSPAKQETPYLKKLPPNEQVTGSFMAPYSIHRKPGRTVSWFGVVRGISSAGGGDFQATLDADPRKAPALALVGVYGTVKDEIDNVPQVAVDYIRVWPWLTFTFTDLGAKDLTNPRWAKHCNLCKYGHIYKPYPTEDYYLGMLGDPEEFGLALKSWEPR